MYRYISEERLKISKAVKSKSQELAPENVEILIFQSSYDGGQTCTKYSWLGTNCQMKHVGWGILLALNSPYLRR